MKMGMRLQSAALAAAITLIALTGPAAAEPAFGYNLELDVVYGQGLIAPNGVETTRDLMLDVYTPSQPTGDTARPAVILVHGGAYYRGARRATPFRGEGSVHSRQEDYARLFAPMGYVAFVIEYRLAPELPIAETPLNHPNLQDPLVAVTEAGIARTNFVRDAMGLPILSLEETREISWATALASAEDVYKAVEFVRNNADLYNVDPDRIAIGGHSAGAGALINAAFGLRAKVKAIFPLSPTVAGFDLSKVLREPELPATLLILAQNDLDSVAESIPPMLVEMEKARLDYEFAWVPGFGHFYPTGAITLGDDAIRTSVGERVTDFLADNL